MRVIIVDDEYSAREIIKDYLSERPDIEILGECNDGFSALKAINEMDPELVFLDIQMPKLNGFEVLEVLEKHPYIIFTTAYDEYAIKAFEMNATDYLLKPFSKERFFNALDKVPARKDIKTGSFPQLRGVVDNVEGLINRIVVKKGGEVNVIPVSSIVYIEAQDDYVMLYLHDKKFLKQKTMAFFEAHLNPNEFIRVHRSYIVKLDEIRKIEPYEKASYIIVLKDGRSIPLSRSGYSKLKSQLLL